MVDLTKAVLPCSVASDFNDVLSCAQWFGFYMVWRKCNLTNLMTINADSQQSGAVSIDRPFAVDDIIKARHFEQLEEKAAIGRFAASLIEPGDTVLLDMGTTTLEVAKALKDRSDVTVLTNSLSILNELADSSLDVYSLSGRMRKTVHSFDGNLVVNTLQYFHVNKAFFGCAGYSLEYGLTEPIYETAQNRGFFIQHCDEAILVVNSDKFGKNSTVIVENNQKVKTIVTDTGLSEEWRRKLQEKGIRVLLAEPEGK